MGILPLPTPHKLIGQKRMENADLDRVKCGFVCWFNYKINQNLLQVAREGRVGGCLAPKFICR